MAEKFPQATFYGIDVMHYPGALELPDNIHIVIQNVHVGK